MQRLGPLQPGWQEMASPDGTYYYNEKVEHQYELTALASKGAFFHVRPQRVAPSGHIR